MSQSDGPQAGQARKKSSTDRWVKLGFLAVVVVVAAAVYIRGWAGSSPGQQWRSDLEAALAEAKKSNRPVLVLFRGEALDEDTNFVMGEKGLKQSSVNREVKEGNYLCVEVKLDRALTSTAAVKYKLTKLPTVIVLSAEGKVLQRESGRVGHVDLVEMLSAGAGGPASSPATGD